MISDCYQVLGRRATINLLDDLNRMPDSAHLDIAQSVEMLPIQEIAAKAGLEEDDLEFKADVQEIAVTDARDGTITLSFGAATGSVDVEVTADTMFLDDEASRHFDLYSLVLGDKVEIDARIGADGAFYASSLHVEDDAGYAIEGPTESIDDVSITVLGISFGLDMDTFFENGMPVAGDYVEVEDDDADGIADQVELDD